MEITKTWEQMKSLASEKSLIFQYDYMSDTPERYFTFLQDENVIYTCQFNADSAAGSEFAGSYLSDANKPVRPTASDSTPYVRVTEKTVGKMMQLYGIEFLGSANNTTIIDTKWTNDIEFVGMRGTCINAHDNDKLDAILIDKDNILGAGSDYVITEFGKDIPAKLLELQGCVAEATTAATVISGLYVRLSYENTGSTDARVYAALRYYL